MDSAELAALVGVEPTDPAVVLAAGRDRAEALIAAVQGAETREALAGVLASILADEAAVDDLGGLARQAPGEWAGVLARLRAVRGIAADLRTLARMVEARGRGLRVVRRGDAHGAPYAPEGWTTPHGYQVDARGVWRVTDGDEGERICTVPLYIAGRLVDVESGECALRLRWPSWTGRPVDHVADTVQLADRAGLVSLAAYGLPVGSHNAREVAAYIDAATAANAGALPVEQTAGRCGWVAGGFLLGDRWIGDDPGVALRCDEGAQQLADGLTAAGSWDAWVATIHEGRWNAGVWVALYSSIASVLLDYLDVPTGFIVDWSGETSQGKTTVLRVAASVWGEPSQRGLVQSWSLTTSRAEGVASFLSHLPICLDDTKQARRTDDVAALLYAHAWGQSKGRAKPGRGSQSVGLRVSATWRSVMLSTGEARATSFSEDAGARARTICLVGSPLSSASVAQALTLGTLQHHGHLGPRVVDCLLRPDGRDRYRAAYDHALTHYRRVLGEQGAVAGRLAEPVALLYVAQAVAEDAGLPAPPEGLDPLAYVAEAAITGGEDADRPSAALCDVLGAAFATPTALYGRHELREGSPAVPPRGWIGAMRNADAWARVDLRASWVR
ncbi:MAG: hypothetical protein CL625_00290, partial [Arenimonas sp.]|nr:hypothetical protein [Arenimonas sp.]